MSAPLFSIVLRLSAALRMGEAFWTPLLAARRHELIIDGAGTPGASILEGIGAKSVVVTPERPLGELYTAALAHAEGQYILFSGDGRMFRQDLPSAYEAIVQNTPDIDAVFSGDTFFYYSKDLPAKRDFFKNGRQSRESMRKGLALGIIDRHFPLVKTARLREADVHFPEKWEPIIHHGLALQCFDAGQQFFYLKKDFHEPGGEAGETAHTHTLRRRLNARRSEWLGSTVAEAAGPTGTVSLNRATSPSELLDAFLQGKKFTFTGLVESRETLLMLLYYNSFFESVALYDPLDVCRVLGSFAKHNISLTA